MDLDEIINSDKKDCTCRKANKLELLAKLKAQSNEETKERLHKFLEEVSSIVTFALDRLNETAQEYEEIAALGNFGAIIATTLQGKPMAYAATGSKSAIFDTMQFAMLKTMANTYGDKDVDEQDNGEEEGDE